MVKSVGHADGKLLLHQVHQFSSLSMRKRPPPPNIRIKLFQMAIYKVYPKIWYVIHKIENVRQQREKKTTIPV